MVQQMNVLPVQPTQPTVQTAPATPAQQTDSSTGSAATFQSMMQASADKLNQGEAAKTRKAKPTSAQEKETNKAVLNSEAQAVLQVLQGLNPIGNANAAFNAMVSQSTSGTQQAVGKIDVVSGNATPQNLGVAGIVNEAVQAGAQANTSANVQAGIPVLTGNAQSIATNTAAPNAAVAPNTAAQSTAAPNVLTAQQNPAVQVQGSQPAQQIVQQAAVQSVQPNLQGMAQPTDAKANQPVLTQNAAAETPVVQGQTNLQAAQAETVVTLNQNLQEKPAVQATDGKVQTVQAKQTDLPITAKVADTDEKAAANQQNHAEYAQLFQNGKVVIPISDSSTNVQKSVPTQLTDTITANLQNGKKEFQVDLFPKDLGKVSVKLASENGVLTVQIMASNPKTQSLLLSGSSEIKSILQATVHQPVQVVDANQNKQAYDEQQHNHSNAQQQQQQEENQHQHRNYHMLYDNDDDSISTVDFLSVMRQLSVNA
ncbi:MAG TPA: flagellar hook-length control protein FliK [Oscillospiraceae bacterium]|nr:flagellar hook-length control protein FliK [Oscillospiraceae bacterium]